MLRYFIHFVLMVAAVCMLLGCGTGPFQKGTLLDDNWGRSYETARSQQILNPDAGKNLEPVEGLDGDAALRSLEHYRKSFEQTEKGASYSIDLTPVGTSK